VGDSSADEVAGVGHVAAILGCGRKASQRIQANPGGLRDYLTPIFGIGPGKRGNRPYGFQGSGYPN
jgi:hypothetical protein